jgi:hypothetical protein
MSGNSQESILGEKWLARPRVACFQRRSNNLRIHQGDCKNIGLNDKRQRGVKREERGGEPQKMNVSRDSWTYKRRSFEPKQNIPQPPS